MLPVIPQTRFFQEKADLMWKGVPHRVRHRMHFPPAHQDLRALIIEIVETEFDVDWADAFQNNMDVNIKDHEDQEEDEEDEDAT